MSVRLFHPSVAIFVQQVARSLHEAGQLDRFVTTVRDNPCAFHQQLLCAAGRIAGYNLRDQFARRAIMEIPLELVETHPWGELLRLASGAFDHSGRLTDFVWERTETGFDRRVARGITRALTGVYGFEFSSLATFQRARELGVRVAYDIPAPEPNFVRSLLNAEMEKFPELRTAYHRHTAEREDARTARRRAEWQSADLILVNSHFTRNSYERAGLDCSKVKIANLGAPPPLPRDLALRRRNADDALRFIWAGTFSIRKGAHYVLEAWRAGGLGRHARLDVFGAVAVPARVLEPLPVGIHFHGSVPRSELLEQYPSADALLFPTLCDGFGMVVREAWSRALPVITTDRAGAADLLQAGRNGLLIPAGDTAAIIEVVEWCETHRCKLEAMREAALTSAAAWQWSDYRRHHRAVLHEAGLFSST
jgi:glycosyltransferase involved in cell wall biosynthesis